MSERESYALSPNPLALTVKLEGEHVLVTLWDNAALRLDPDEARKLRDWLCGQFGLPGRSEGPGRDRCFICQGTGRLVEPTALGGALERTCRACVGTGVLEPTR